MTQPYSPFLPDNNLILPRERVEVNAWSRHYTDTDPFIGTWMDEIALEVTGEFSINGSIDARGQYRKRFINAKGEFKEQDNLIEMARELNICGEAFPTIRGDGFILPNPDFIKVKGNPLAKGNTISLLADDELKRIVASKKKRDKALVKQLEDEVVGYIKDGKAIPLSSDITSHLMIKASPYNLRGRGRLVKYFKTLMADDSIREDAFLNKVPMPELYFKKAALLDSKSNAFYHSLVEQRKLITEWMEQKLFKDLNLTVSWKNDINMEAFLERISE